MKGLLITRKILINVYNLIQFEKTYLLFDVIL